MESRGKRHAGVELAVLSPLGWAHATNVSLATLSAALDRFEPLLGPFPGKQFRLILSNSGPEFSLPDLAMVDVGSLSQAPAMIDERDDDSAEDAARVVTATLLGSWLGGECFGTCEGDWREPLAMYAGDLTDDGTSGSIEQARARRARIVDELSLLGCAPDSVGRQGGSVPGGLGWDMRGYFTRLDALSLHAFARKVGDAAFREGVRGFIRDHRGGQATVVDLASAVLQTAGRPRDDFPGSLVSGESCPPELSIESALYWPQRGVVSVTFTQSEPTAEARVTIRLFGPGGEIDADLSAPNARQTVDIPVPGQVNFVALDPEFHTPRRVSRERVVPSMLLTLTSSELSRVVDPRDADAYRPLLNAGEDPAAADSRKTLAPSQLAEGALARRGVLIVGSAALSPYVSGFLSAVDFPVRCEPNGFEALDESFDGPLDAVVATIRHPGNASAGISLVYANSRAAIPLDRVVAENPYSVVVFRAGRPIVRWNSDEPEMIPVSRP